MMGKAKLSLWSFMLTMGVMLFGMSSMAFAGEADIKLPDLSNVVFTIAGNSVGGVSILNFGLLVCIIGLIFGYMQYVQTKNLPAHSSMLSVSNTIWETCKTYVT
ncbi:MAG TPA: sodium-translocating pyrophosphatase, partial [Deltaproteobacteria bacterium]|nr:sodium-translocating pyrophosphatase [Deltaproteobacteria bacterium]